MNVLVTHVKMEEPASIKSIPSNAHAPKVTMEKHATKVIFLIKYMFTRLS